MKRATLLAALLLALGLSCGRAPPAPSGEDAGTGAGAPAAPPPSTAPSRRIELTLLPQSGALTDALAAALSDLIGPQDPLLKGHKQIVFQRVPDEKSGIALLLVGGRGDAARSEPFLPAVCEVHHPASLHGVTFCGEDGACEEVPPSGPPVILCNGWTWLKIDLLLRLLHDDVILRAHMASDVAYMRLAQRMETDLMSVAEQADRIRIDAAHRFYHLVMAAMFVLAHEVGHLRKGTSRGAFTPARSRTPSTERICRHYERMAKLGLGVDAFNAMLAFAGPAPLSPEDEAVAAADVRTMDEEEAADGYAAERVRRLVDKLVQEGHVPLDVALGEYAFNTLSNVALYLWYRSLAPVLLPTCADLADQRFFVTRCMCRDRVSYMRAQQSFSSTHPPIYLRMRGVLDGILHKEDFARLDRKSLELMSMRTAMMGNLLATTVQLAGGACFLQRKDSKALGGLEQIYVTYPGLEGIHSRPIRADLRIGWPVDTEEAALRRACSVVPPAR